MGNRARIPTTKGTSLAIDIFEPSQSISGITTLNFARVQGRLF
jgi:hypothetical protein